MEHCFWCRSGKKYSGETRTLAWVSGVSGGKGEGEKRKREGANSHLLSPSPLGRPDTQATRTSEKVALYSRRKFSNEKKITVSGFSGCFSVKFNDLWSGIKLTIIFLTIWPNRFAYIHRVFSHDVILVSQNNETAAMLVSQTNPMGFWTLFISYAKVFFCSNKFA